MERERLREPEPREAVLYDNSIRDRMQWIERQRTGQVLIRSEDRKYQASRQGRLKQYLNPMHFPDTAVDHWSVFVHDIQRQSGRHRHQGGLIIYVIEGEGATEVDGQVLDWQAGDLLLLPIKADGVAHQHVNRDTSKGCRWIAFVYRPLGDYVAHFIEQLQETPDFKGEPTRMREVLDGTRRQTSWKTSVPVDQLPPAVTHPDQLASVNLFDRLVELRDYQRLRQETATWMIRGAELPWEINAHGKMQWYLHPLIAYTTIHTLMFYRQQIPEGSRSGLQRHGGDTVFFILQGEGYTELDGVRHAWKAEDIMTLPLRPGGNIYRHVNTGDQPVQLIACEPNLVHTVDLDRGVGFEELEPCPEYRDLARASR